MFRTEHYRDPPAQIRLATFRPKPLFPENSQKLNRVKYDASLEYHGFMRRLNPASLAACGILLLFSVPFAVAQFNGGASASSSSSSSHSSTSAASFSPSVGHYTPPSGISTPPTGSVHPPTGGITPPTGTHSGNPVHRPHPSSGDTAYVPYYYPYYYGVADPYADSQDGGAADAPDDSADYQGGPTIFDRRGTGSDSYIAPSPDSPDGTQNGSSGNEAAAQSDVEQPPIPTELVFKDGHQLEVNNYAIVNQTLFDLTPGHVRKVPLADLDLAATEKQNDDRGVIFQPPPTSQAN